MAGASAMGRTGSQPGRTGSNACSTALRYWRLHGTRAPPRSTSSLSPLSSGSMRTMAATRTAAGVTDPAVALPDRDWELVRAMVDAVERRWAEPDHGIWEIRGNPRHHVYSKVMCWLTVDRALTLAETYGREAQLGWTTLRDVIAQQVREQGWNDEAQSYTAAYDGTDLDAATLHIGLSGLIEPDDPRFQATVLATEAELRSGATVYRYHHDDGLPGGEGGFHLCAAWLVEAYLLIGQRQPAEALFTQLVAAAGPTGLLSEEYDPVAERSLGNHPQAYSHLGLLRCAQLLSAER